MRHDDELFRLLSELVAIPSVNPMGQSRGGKSSSSDMVEFLEAWFRQRGIGCERQIAGGGEENLIVTVEGKRSGRTILFDAHTDTVPAEGWPQRAFVPRIEEGRLYGRGACDTKGSLAAMMWALASAAETGKLADTIVLLASADEEYSRSGVRAFLAAGGHADGVVVGEPTSCRPVIACKGAARWELIVRGRSAHTCRPRRGINSIVRAARLIGRIAELDLQCQAQKVHPLVSPATLTVSLIQGGEAVNMVPDACRLTVDLRTLPGEDPSEAMDSITTQLDEHVDFPLEYGDIQFWPGCETDPNHDFVRHCLACVAGSGPSSKNAEPAGADYGCHASDYAARGMPFVVLGPGSIDNAHRIDEFVEIEELARAADIYRHLMTVSR